MVWTRRGLVLALAVSAMAGLGLLAGALLHDPAAASAGPVAGPVSTTGPASQLEGATAGHEAMEWGLWLGVFASVLVFSVAWSFFRREVRLEKARMRRARDRRDLLREVRDYRRTIAGPPRRNT